MGLQAPWSPTAHAFAQHQFSHVANFWKQGRPASFQLEALPGGHAKLSLSFQLPQASEVVPPPSKVLPAPAPQQRPIPPLFPEGCFPHVSGADSKIKHASKKVSSKQRKSYQRSVLHRASLAASSLPPPKNGSLRQAALACVQRQQAVSASPVTKKRPLPDSPSALSPSNLPPLSQRIRKDIQIGESEAESPEKEVLRSPALKISWGPPTANLWPDWSPQKRVNCNKLDQRQKMRKSRFNHQFCSKTCFNHQYYNIMSNILQFGHDNEHCFWNDGI